MSGEDGVLATVERGVAGIPIAESAVDLVSASADALDGEASGLNGVAAVVGIGAEVSSAVADPVGYFAAAGMGWVIEHVPPLKWSLDAVSGNPEEIKKVTKAWTETVGKPMATVAEKVRDAASATTSGWSGSDADAYRKATTSLSTISDVLGKAATRSASGLATAGALVVEVRNTIRDELAQLCTWGLAMMTVASAASVPTGGGSVVTAMNTILMRAGMLAQRFAALLQRLTTKLESLADKFSALGTAAQALRRASTSIDGVGTTVTSAVADGATVRTALSILDSAPITTSATEWGSTAVVSALKVAGDNWKATAATTPQQA